jgi:chorismate-pyruvate lyase
VVADRLAARHFTAQEDLPEDLEPVALAALNPFLRGLLLTDGTVSRTLEAHTLRPVLVERVEQSEQAVPEKLARHLLLADGEACVRRRIAMRIATEDPSVWAESFVVPDRLPPTFLTALDGNGQGIGGSLQQLKLESWRELLWFGLGKPPVWPGQTGTARRTLRRAYLILTHSRPALLICEDFALREDSGLLGLAGTVNPR